MIHDLRVLALKTQASPAFRCDACCRYFPISDLGYVERGVRLCAGCFGIDLQTHLGVITVFQSVVRALQGRRFQLAKRFAAWGISELARLNGDVPQ